MLEKIEVQIGGYNKINKNSKKRKKEKKHEILNVYCKITEMLRTQKLKYASNCKNEINLA